MRLFVAIALPEPHRRQLAARLATLAAGGPRARWEHGEKLHLTLRFLGEVAPERVAPLEAALREAAERVAPVMARLTAAGAFPAAGRARVLWLGVEPAAELARLQEVAEAAVAPFAEREERRPFHPHVTLARCDPPWGAREVERFAASLGAPAPEPFRVGALALVESRLGTGGSRHREVASFPLGGDGNEIETRGEERG